jgi:hypothetical protein
VNRRHGRHHRGEPDRVRPETPLDLDALRQLPPTPDLARSIMGRLGYMHLAPNAARRQSIRQWAHRGVLLLAVAATMTAGVWIQQAGSAARASVSPTLPDAVRHDLRSNVRQINSALDTIRGRLTPLTPPAQPDVTTEPSSSSETPEEQESIERSALGPGCWV